MPPLNVLVDLTGQSFGIWKVIEQAPRRDNKTRWLCECATCGARCSMRSTSLRRYAYAKCFGTHNRRQGVPSPLRKPAGYAAGTEKFSNYRAAATKRGFAFALTRAEFDALTSQDCHYCAAPPGNKSSRRHFNGVFVYSGIDRIDSTVGYVTGNCLSCCNTCNVMKQDLPYDVFLAHIDRIHSLHSSHVDPTATGRMSLGLRGNSRRANMEES